MGEINRQYSSLPKADVLKLRHLLRYLVPYRWLLLGMVVALLVSSSSVLSIGYGLRYLVDEGFSKGDKALLDTALLGLFGITLVLSLSTYARYYLITRVGEQVVADMRRDVFRHLIRLSPEFYENTKTGEVLSRLTTDTTVIQLVVGSSLSIALRNTVLFLGGITLLISTSPKLTAYIIVIVPLVVLSVLSLARRVRRLSRTAQDKIAEIASHLEETLLGIKTVQAYGREHLETVHFTTHVKEALAASLNRVATRGKLTALVIALSLGSVGLVLWVGGRDVLTGAMSAGELASFVFYSVVVAGAMAAISEVVGDLQRAAGATERLVELLNAKPNITLPEMPVALPEKLEGRVVFDKVTFYYPTRPETPALQEVSFSVKPGKMVALVGPSGAGKTSILELLLRFYDPQAGKITLDGVDIRAVDFYALREHIAYVTQDPVIFSDTAWANIRYGNVNASDEEVIEAAKAAHAYDFLSALPDGFDTHLGERGQRLSGGEKQRLAIARALVKRSKILLLDEATNALDAESEKLVQNALEQIMQQCTTLVVAHRLATVLKADNIIVINEGRVEAMGTHKELVAQGSLYARLAELQFGE